MKGYLSAVVAVVCLATPGLATQMDRDPELARGVDLVQRGDFENGVTVLDATARRLAASGAPAGVMARAYAYLAVAYLGLNHEQTAKAKFIEALTADRTLKLDPNEFPPRIIALFQEARREMTPPAPPPKRSSMPIIIGGGVAAAGIAVATMAGGGNDGTAPATTATTVAPSGTITVTLTVNDQTGGTVFCSRGLFFRIYASNSFASTVAVNRLDLSFTSSTPACVSHQSPISGAALLVPSLGPGASNVLVRQADLAGDLCDPPNGVPGCLWLAHGVLTTGSGDFTADLQFTSAR